jgi:hypothetical protein
VSRDRGDVQLEVENAWARSDAPIKGGRWCAWGHGRSTLIDENDQRAQTDITDAPETSPETHPPLTSPVGRPRDDTNERDDMESSSARAESDEAVVTGNPRSELEYPRVKLEA